MKKHIAILISILCLFISTPIYGTTVKYYGIGAQVKKIDHTTFQIQTEGSRANEGFGIASIDVHGRNEVSFQSDFKGEGTIIVKIAQKDGNGKIVKEATSKPISLTSKWDMKQAEMKLTPKTKEIQIMFLTNDKQHQEFFLKNIKIQTEDKPTL